MGIKLAAASGGSVELVPTNTASNFTVTVPAASTTIVGTDTAQTLTNKTLTTPIIPSTVGVGGATPSASGAGITFPATQSASTDANTLDDYEEGTWTPVMNPSAGVIYTATTSGNYVKVGRLVTLTFNAQSLTGVMTAMGSISGLPFVINTNTPVGASREWYASGNMWQSIGNNGASSFSLLRYDNSSVCNSQFAWNGTFSYITNN